jgi:adenine/guanine phosphoribosyltransferase-like PRPP-binding protein
MREQRACPSLAWTINDPSVRALTPLLQYFFFLFIILTSISKLATNAAGVSPAHAAAAATELGTVIAIENGTGTVATETESASVQETEIETETETVKGKGRRTESATVIVTGTARGGTASGKRIATETVTGTGGSGAIAAYRRAGTDVTEAEAVAVAEAEVGNRALSSAFSCFSTWRTIIPVRYPIGFPLTYVIVQDSSKVKSINRANPYYLFRMCGHNDV